MQDFEDEIECFLNTTKIVNILKDIDLSTVSSNKLFHVYSTLAKHRYINQNELKILKAWNKDINQLYK